MSSSRVRSKGGVTPAAHFDEAQAEQALRQEFRDHGASINNALTEALRIHGGPLWLAFQVGVLRWIRGSFSHPLCVRTFSDPLPPRSQLLAT
jgi:hypothetical protein